MKLGVIYFCHHFTWEQKTLCLNPLLPLHWKYSERICKMILLKKNNCVLLYFAKCTWASGPLLHFTVPVNHCVLSTVVLAYGSFLTSLMVIIITLEDFKIATASWCSMLRKLWLLTSIIWSPTYHGSKEVRFRVQTAWQQKLSHYTIKQKTGSKFQLAL